MKKLSTVLLGLGLLVSSALYAAEANKSTTQQATHMGDHMHEGKNEVKAKEAGMKKEVKEHIIASSPKKIIKASKPNINSTKEITSSSSNDEWESF